jgi:hypothetical protein
MEPITELGESPADGWLCDHSYSRVPDHRAIGSNAARFARPVALAFLRLGSPPCLAPHYVALLVY